MEVQQLWVAIIFILCIAYSICDLRFDLHLDLDINEELNNNNCVYTLIDSDISKETNVVNLHNQCRQQIANNQISDQPAGKNIKDLKWDDKLAKKALYVANICLFEHLKPNDTRFDVGQNLYIECTTADYIGSNWNLAIDSWFNEHLLFPYPNTTPEILDITGHYTQIVWADTKYVGCAESLFKIYENDNISNQKVTQQMARKGMEVCRLYVCNYGPAGNIIGQKPYKIK